MSRICEALPSLLYMCPLNLSCGWVENIWSSTFTTLHVSIEIYITWLSWEYVELYLHSPTCIHWTFYMWLVWESMDLFLHSPTCVPWTYHLAALECVEHYLNSRTFVHWSFHVDVFRIGGALPQLPYKCPLNISRSWFENGWNSTSTPLNVSTRFFFTWLCCKIMELYFHSPTSLHRTFYLVTVLWIVGALPPPLHMFTELFVTWRGWE